MGTAKNEVDIFGDVETFGCGCQNQVDPKTGKEKLQYRCRRHRFLLDNVAEKMR
jgi:hypothetical protein